MTTDNTSIPNQAEQLTQAGIRAAKAGQNAEARRLLRQALELADSDEAAWLWLATVVETPGERRVCLETVLELNPENTVARRALAQLADSPEASKSGLPRRRAVINGRSNRPRWILLAVMALIVLVIGGAAVEILPGLRQSPASLITPSETRIPTATLSFISQQQTSDAQAIASVTAQLAPLTREPTTIRNFAPVLPSWTPKPTSTLPASLAPTATALPLAELTLAFTSNTAASDNGIYLISADGTHKQLLLQADVSLSNPVWSPDGTQLAYIAAAGSAPTLMLANADGSKPHTLTQAGGKYLSAPSWSPDGSQIAFAATTATTGHAALYIIHPDGTRLRMLTDGSAECHDPAWSPDGKQIVYAADPFGRGAFQLYRLDPAAITATPPATDQSQALTESANSNYSPAWSPDGSRLAFVSTRDGHAVLYTMAADGGDPRPLELSTDTAESREPTWSPDGRWLVFSSNRQSGTFVLYRLMVDTLQVSRVTDLGHPSAQPRFRPVH